MDSLGTITNVLDPGKQQQRLAFLELGGSLRRIELETGIRHETVSCSPIGLRLCLIFSIELRDSDVGVRESGNELQLSAKCTDVACEVAQ